MIKDTVMLPNVENALIQIEKIRDYSLNINHPTGKNKAKVFQKVFNLTQIDCYLLKEIILEKIKENEAVFCYENQYGRYYSVDFLFERNNRTASIRTSWIIRRNENFARLISCYVLTEKRGKK